MSVTQPTAVDKTRFGKGAPGRCNSQVRVANPTESVELALAPALRLRLLGTGLAAVGLCVLVGVGVAWVVGAPTAVATGLVVLGGAGVLTLGLLLGVRRWVIRLDDQGYRVRVLRPQARAARWSDVLDLQAINAGRARHVVLRLRDGRTTALPVDAVEGGPVRLTELLTSHLSSGPGKARPS